MPTNRPKLTAYLSPELYDWLLKYQQKNKLTSLSKAAIKALTEYQSMVEEKTKNEREKAVAEVRQELDVLRERIEQLTRKIEQLEKE